MQGALPCPFLMLRFGVIAMATIELRDLHLAKIALAIAVLVIEWYGPSTVRVGMTSKCVQFWKPKYVQEEKSRCT